MDYIDSKKLKAKIIQFDSKSEVSKWSGITDLGFRFRTIELPNNNLYISESLYPSMINNEIIINVHQNICYKFDTKFEVLLQLGTKPQIIYYSVPKFYIFMIKYLIFN